MNTKLVPNKMTIGDNAVITLATRTMQFILSFATNIIIARTVGPSGKGIYFLVVLTHSLTIILGGIGLPRTNACFAGQKRNKILELWSNSVLLVFVFILCLAIIYGILYLVHIFDSQTLKYIAFAFCFAPLGLLSELSSGIVWGRNRIREFNLITIMRPLCILILLSFFVITLGLDLKRVLAAWAMSVTIVAGLSVLILRREGISKFSPNLHLMKASLKFGSQVWLSQIIGKLNFRFDIFLVAYFLTVKQVGYYSVAVTIADILFYIPSAIAVALLPTLTSNNAQEAARKVGKSCRISLLPVVILAFALGLTAKYLIPAIYGQAFFSSVSPLIILLPGATIYGLAHITTAYFDGYLGRPGINAGVAGLSLCINICLNIILIPKLGINGAALSSTVSYIAAMGVGVYIYNRMSKTSVKDMVTLRMDDIKSYIRLAVTYIRRVSFTKG